LILGHELLFSPGPQFSMRQPTIQVSQFHQPWKKLLSESPCDNFSDILQLINCSFRFSGSVAAAS
jgi:hypothetical protein